MRAYKNAYYARASDRQKALRISARRNWNVKNRKRIREELRQRRLTDCNLRCLEALRARIACVVRAKNGLKAKKTIELLGCSIPNFRMYLESRFEPGMCWENYGVNGWHVDHIMPCAIFNLSNPDHQKRCFHFSNLQPMWAVDNRRKGAKVSALKINLL